jgi:hypothetical protein
VLKISVAAGGSVRGRYAGMQIWFMQRAGGMVLRRICTIVEVCIHATGVDSASRWAQVQAWTNGTVCYKEKRKGEGWKREESKQETKGHTQ